jgi:hypothetical protein
VDELGHKGLGGRPTGAGAGAAITGPPEVAQQSNDYWCTCALAGSSSPCWLRCAVDRMSKRDIHLSRSPSAMAAIDFQERQGFKVVDSSDRGKSLQSLSRDMQQEYIRKALVLAALMVFVFTLMLTGSERTTMPMVLVFAMVVDLLGIKRCQRLCEACESQLKAGG